MLALLCGCGHPAAPTEEWQSLGQTAIRYLVAPRNPAAPQRPRVLLLADAARGPEVWEGFRQQLAAAGHEVVVVDAQASPAKETPPLLQPLCEVEGGCALIGEGTGAFVALGIAAASPQARALVMLSAPLTAAGINGIDTMRGFNNCPVLLMATEDDLAASTAALQYKDAAPAFCEIQLYPGNAHGADIFALRPNAILSITDWLRLILDKKE